MPRKPDPARRLANQADHHRRQAARASTPIAVAATAFDRWRAVIAELPETQRQAWIDVMTRALNTHADRITQTLAPEGAPQ
jgi:hypothetical protein